jgi:hypothetical protein
MRVTPQSTGAYFDLCDDCFYIWDNDKRRNPAESEAYMVYRSIDPDLPKDKWLLLNEKPIPRNANNKMQYRDSTAMPGAVYYVYIVTINALGFKSDASEVFKMGDKDEFIDLE